jgi:hypothetical protein
MRYYLKHLFELYVEYTKLAFSGMAVSSLLLAWLAAVKTGSVIVSAIGILVVGIVVALFVIRERRRRTKQELEKVDLARREEEKQLVQDEVMLLLKELNGLDADGLFVFEALEEFLSLQKELDDTSHLASLRRRVIESVTPKILARKESKEEKDRKIAG